MKIKLKYKEINNSVQPISEMVKLNLPIGMSFSIYKNMENIKKPLEFYNKKITELVTAYCEKDKTSGEPIINKDGSLLVKPDKKEGLYKKCAELDNLDVELEIDKINKDELRESIEEIIQNEPKTKIKPSSIALILSLDFMFE